MEATIIKYAVIVLIVASLSAYTTHRITVNSYAEKALIVQNAEVIAKDVIETKIATAETKQIAVVQEQAKIKEVVRIQYQDVIKTNTVYVDKACSIPDDGIKLMDDTATKLNNTRK